MPPAALRKTPPARADKPGKASRSRSQPRVFDVDCQLGYELQQPTHFLFQIHAQHGRDQQVLSESLACTPAMACHVYPDPLLHHRFMRLTAPAGRFELHYTARVQLAPRPRHPAAEEIPTAQLPDDVMHHLMPTRYCESDLLAHAAQKIFGAAKPGYARVQAISDWIHDNIDYQVGSSDASTTAREVFWRRAGVCRDFAHLGVTFCRALNIPARLAVGYAVFDEPPPDFHAVFEAFIGGEWVMFDPTRLSPVENLVRIAAGRDAKDLAFSTIFGPASMTRMAPQIAPVA
ncbi:MAG TPA: transglutaminase family protein [Ideonella sp.]|nr:transglutaminase family protein [Ideonella sp.]